MIDLADDLVRLTRLAVATIEELAARCYARGITLATSGDVQQIADDLWRVLLALLRQCEQLGKAGTALCAVRPPHLLAGLGIYF